MRRRNPNPRRAIALFTYSVADMAALYGCHRSTVRNWLRFGLEPIDEKRPALVRGDVLNAFHASRRAKGKHPCGLAEIYCAPCHEPRRPAGDLVDIEPVNAKVWKVSGICPVCDRVITQRAGIVRLAHFRALEQLSAAKPPGRIRDASVPSANCGLEEKGNA
jgi:hypothetical protein